MRETIAIPIALGDFTAHVKVPADITAEEIARIHKILLALLK